MKNLVQYGSKELQNRELIAFLLTSFKPELGGY
jgi:DNA repair protein RadC